MTVARDPIKAAGDALGAELEAFRKGRRHDCGEDTAVTTAIRKPSLTIKTGPIRTNALYIAAAGRIVISWAFI